MRALAACLAILFIFSCGDDRKQAASVIATLEQELKQTDSLYVTLKQNPGDSILSVMDQTLRRVTSVLADTMSAETEEILEEYLELQSALKDYDAGMDTLQKELSYSSGQVSALRKDTETGALEVKELEKHAQRELGAIQMIRRNITRMDSWFQTTRATFNSADELLNQKITADSLLNVH